MAWAGDEVGFIGESERQVSHAGQPIRLRGGIRMRITRRS
jgi:hypothetical protein